MMGVCLLVASSAMAGMANMADMQMDDASRFGKLMIDQLEARGSAGGWDVEGWYGGDYNKIMVKAEGERSDGLTLNASAEVSWDHVMGRWWEGQVGVRQDFGRGPSRTWLALGIEGLAPYWLSTEATLYAGEQGLAARLKAEYDLLLTQRLVLQPYAEVNLYTQSDPARGVGSGLSDLEISLRLRYEVRRQFAPYMGVGWFKHVGGNDLEFLAGLRMWF